MLKRSLSIAVTCLYVKRAEVVEHCYLQRTSMVNIDGYELEGTHSFKFQTLLNLEVADGALAVYTLMQ
jgi:hypothetical protein